MDLLFGRSSSVESNQKAKADMQLKLLWSRGCILLSEKNYAHIEREALAIVFGLKIYHNYLFGRRFELVTDHSPLTIIFDEKKNVSVTAAVQLQRWAILLSAYEYQIVYKKKADISNADALSRLPLPDDTEVELASYSFGVVPRSLKFQEVMDRILIGLNSTLCYLDNILIGGRLPQENLVSPGKVAKTQRAVFSHVINGGRKPISFDSKTLSLAEKNYAQIEREALAILFGLKIYHNYLFGRRFELVTDHSPLTIIFDEKKKPYEYQIVYKKEADISNADALSRLPLPDDTEVELASYCFSIKAPVTALFKKL
ncbi:hypothetical protein ILUMI_04125 [Ignelater luminosus]|uniref:Reverse transcriptase RNase H-like domain-containing protein n=1 Tax=Ignelater luminosus TaxID=2038154 RepID=A0A8K0DD66_IGNLU|nr:hypothetical protein ILUMI_04125 [Ignelater luminosus]